MGGNKPIGGRLDALAAFEYGAAHYPVGGGGETTPTAPVLRLETDALSIKAHESVTIGFTAYDPNGDSFTLDGKTYAADGDYHLASAAVLAYSGQFCDHNKKTKMPLINA